MHKIGFTLFTLFWGAEQGKGKGKKRKKGNKGKGEILTPSDHTHWQMHLTQNPATWKKP